MGFYSGTAGIETPYGGVIMRSRLECRWALFFETLGLTWAYEPECFALKAGNYLPDFRVSWPGEFGVWIEVKPSVEALTRRDLRRYTEFSEDRVLLLAVGAPHAARLPYAKDPRADSGVLLLPDRPVFVLSDTGHPFDLGAVHRAAEAAGRLRFQKEKK